MTPEQNLVIAAAKRWAGRLLKAYGKPSVYLPLLKWIPVADRELYEAVQELLDSESAKAKT